MTGLLQTEFLPALLGKAYSSTYYICTLKTHVSMPFTQDVSPIIVCGYHTII